ncbi:hypothetical protein SAMN04488095_3301 [Jannaschia pohangensis]|uniref:Uncharacterized protein n=1 Tax=Jannaschia pohangensis TaxID=390807 RepID=A0A1I3T5D1_9RHOB|nr:hypothetical protein SAMN04488095_3301 [Jannaschia pohangensis]
MLKTIMIGTYSSVQGRFVQMLQGGLCQVKVGETVYTGHPINR